VHSDPRLKSIETAVACGLMTPEKTGALLDGLTHSPARAQAIAEFERELDAAGLFNPSWLAKARQRVRSGATITPHVDGLSAQLQTLENVLRIGDALAKFGADAIRKAAEQLLSQNVGADDALAVLRKAALSLAIAQRLRSDPRLQ